MNRTIRIALVALLVAALAGAAFARGPMMPRHGGHGPGPMMMGPAPFADLDLSQDQLKTILKLRYEHQVANLDLHQQMIENRKTVYDLRQDPSANEEQLADVLKRQAELVAKLDTRRDALHEKMMGVLTEEQRNELAKNAWFGSRGGHRGAMMSGDCGPCGRFPGRGMNR